MNIEKKNLDKARELLAELERLEEVDDVLGNYDASAYAIFKTCHNNNTKTLKEVRVPMPPDVSKAMREYISHRIYEIKKELESL